MKNLSDAEVNERLLDLVRPGWREEVRKHMARSELIYARNGTTATQSVTTPDFCNSWSHIGPLIEKHNITLNQQDGCLPEAIVKYDSGEVRFGRAGVNIKRAAALCLIKLLEGRNEL